jgi:hypothetical protein
MVQRFDVGCIQLGAEPAQHHRSGVEVECEFVRPDLDEFARDAQPGEPEVGGNAGSHDHLRVLVDRGDDLLENRQARWRHEVMCVVERDSQRLVLAYRRHQHANDLVVRTGRRLRGERPHVGPRWSQTFEAGE